MFLRSTILLLCLQLLQPAAAQLRFEYNDDGILPAALELQTWSDSSTPFTDEGLYYLLQKRWSVVNDALPGISYSDKHVWIRIPLYQLQQRGPIHWVDIHNPHINRLRAWLVQGDSIIHSFPLTGDAFPFNTRTVPSQSFLFSLHSYPLTHTSLIFAADKRLTKLDMPIHFQSNDHFVAHVDIDVKGLMFFLGFAFFLFLFNAYLFLTTSESVFGWYLAYLALICLYVCTDAGLMFKLVYPGLPSVNDIIRPASFALSVAPMMLFFNKILEVRSHAPRFYLVNRWLFWIYIVLFVMAVGSSAITNDPALQKHWINANRVITPLVMVVLMLESIYFIRKGYSLAIFSLGSFFSLIFFSLVYVGLQIDWLPPNLFTTYSLYWGLAADAAFMGLSLAWRFRLFRQTMDRLMQEKEVRQQQLNIEITTWKEQQMRQFSSLLHDHIGGLIGVLRLSVDNMPLTNDGRIAVSQEIVSIANETRQYSHAFSPIPLHTQGLKAAVSMLVDKIRERSQINFLFEWMGETDVQSQNVALISYHFIQEMLQNMLKHARCDQAILQIINEKNTLSIYLEDNGQGCDVVQFEQGIGLQSMRRIVNLMGGTFHVITARSEGFSLSVELPK